MGRVNKKGEVFYKGEDVSALVSPYEKPLSEKSTPDIQEYEYAKEKNGYTGSLEDWKSMDKKSLEEAKLTQITVPGPDGKKMIRFVRVQEGAEYPAWDAQENRPATPSQLSSFKYWERGNDAERAASLYEDKITKFGLWDQFRLSSDKWPNMLKSETMQNYNQAMRQFTEARLRKDSGAAIPESEFENDRKMYFAQPGDSESVIKRKKEARLETLNALARESGPAYINSFGEPPPPPKKPAGKAVTKGQIVYRSDGPYMVSGKDENGRPVFKKLTGASSKW
jgi:hypothetical protein